MRPTRSHSVRPLLFLLAAGAARASLSDLRAAMMAGYDKNIRPSEAVGAGACAAGDAASPAEIVRAQFHVSKVHSINQIKGSVSLNGYFRLYWNDPRLAFTAVGLRAGIATACFPDVAFDGSGSGAASGLWVPDVYWPDGMETKVGLANEGAQLTVDGDGDIFWSRRARMEFSCPMDFAKMPFDHQHCTIKLGTYRDTVEKVSLHWRDSALSNLGSKLPMVIGAWTMLEYVAREYNDTCVHLAHNLKQLSAHT